MSALSDCQAENKRLRAKVKTLKAELDQALADLAKCKEGTYPGPTTYPNE